MAPRPRLSSVIDLRSLLGWLAVGLLAVLAFKSATAQSSPAKRPASLPDFSFVSADGPALTQQQLAKGRATVVLFFDPGCDHCQRQAEWLRAAEGQFKGAQFVWVSTADMAEIQSFQKKYFAGASVKHHFARDTKYVFDAVFGYSVAPTVLAFDAAGKLRKAWSNEVAADEIAAALK